MALDLKHLKAANERVQPFREGLEALSTLIDAAVESEHLLEKAQRLVKAQNDELNRLQNDIALVKLDIEKSSEMYHKQRDEHKASIQALVEEKRQLLAAMDTELKEHKARIQKEMDHATQVQQQNIAALVTEHAKAKKQLADTQKSLAEMTDRVRHSLGI